MKSDLLNPIRLSLRQADPGGIQFHLGRLLKKASEPGCPARFKCEIYLEAVKAYRALDRHDEADHLCEIALGNIPADSFDLLSALKRLRALLLLDAGDPGAARLVIEETDGIEIVLQGGTTIVKRNDRDVSVETWLISAEVALAEGDAEWAGILFEKAVTRLSSEQAELHHKRISFVEKRYIEQYYHDLGQMLHLYGLTIRRLTGDGAAPKSLRELYDTVKRENDIAITEKKLPNKPLELKLAFLLSPHNGNREMAVAGISTGEARRWHSFGSSNYLESFPDPVFKKPDDLDDSVDPSFSAMTSRPSEDVVSDRSSNTVFNSSEAALNVTATAIEKMANVFSQIEKVLPNFESYIKNGSSPIDHQQRGFSGHMLDTDLYNFLSNINQLRFTGFVKLAWKETLYESAIMKGILPDLVRSGEANLYCVDGYVIDTLFKGQPVPNKVETAQDNFLLLTRMCLSVHVDDIKPDIIGTAVPEPAVADRLPLLKIRDQDMLFIVSDLEEIAAGISKDEGESTFFEKQSAAKSEAAEVSLPDPVNPPSEDLFHRDESIEEADDRAFESLEIKKPIALTQPASFVDNDLLEI